MATELPKHGEYAVHRYADCPEIEPQDDVHADDDDPRPVTCYYCRSWMGLEV